jgi:hypothetical protein
MVQSGQGYAPCPPAWGKNAHQCGEGKAFNQKNSLCMANY